jgi:serine/threonine protein kinase
MGKFELKTKTGKTIILKDEDEIHRGGEGRIILLPPKTGLVAKIYLPGIKGIDESRFDQLQVLDKDLFVRPIDLLYKNGDVVGYTMEYAGKEYFPLSALFSQNFILRNGIDETYKKKIAQKLIDAVKSAHFAGFVIGDLNQYNVLLNLNGDIRFIDVDSYETPGYKHTGILLDDIRDYYYQGIVNMNSDYFALSVLLFSLFTYMHPFKGIHPKYKTLAERMIHKIPVFYDDPLLKIPKCYQPVGNKEIQEEFDKLYLHGQRFLLSINGLPVGKTYVKPQLVNYLDEKDIKIQTIFNDKKLRNVYFNQKLGYIETESEFIIYQSVARGNLSKIMEFDKNQYDRIFVGDQNIIGLKKQKLFILNEKSKPVEIQNFNIPKDSIFYQLGNILITICLGQMYWVYLDEVLNNSIRIKRTEIFSESFTYHSGLIQNTGGVQRIFYNTGKDIATVKLTKPAKKVYQAGNVGIVQFIENKRVVNQYFNVLGLNLEFKNANIESFHEFGYMPGDKENGFVFEPSDSKIIIRRTSDFEIVSEVPCSLVSAQSSLFSSSAGIVIWEMDKVYLVNQQK